MFKKLLYTVRFIQEKIHVFSLKRKQKKSLRILKKLTSALSKEDNEIIKK
jgi:hypothetical protein